MRKRVTYITAFFFLISATELHELVKLPQLVMHYYHHHTEDPSISLNSFIQLHYQQNHPNDKDDSEDRQLPFKSGYDIVHIDLTIALFHHTGTAPYFMIADKPITYFPEGVPSGRACGIFRPPRQS